MVSSNTPPKKTRSMPTVLLCALTSGCTILDAWGWCTGMTQRDGMGREEGGGFRMVNTCIPVVDSALQMETRLEVTEKNDKELYELEL